MRYATYFNTRNERKGHVFERRFTAWVTQKGDAMKRAVQYMHMNPIRAKMEKKLFEYKWTSHEPLALLGFMASQLGIVSKSLSHG